MKHDRRTYEADTGAGGAGAPPPAPAGTSQAPWYASAPAELNVEGYLQNRGLAGKPPEQVALDVIKAHQEATKFLGVSPDKLLRVPDPSDGPATKAFWERLGAPKDATGYDFSTVKTSAGANPDPRILDHMRIAAATLNLPKDAAVEMVKAAVNVIETKEQQVAAETTAKITEAKAALQRDWGVNFEANKFVAAQAAKALGVTAEAVQALENQIGYDKVMQMFHKIGTKIGEDKFVGSGQGPNPGVMSVSQAKDQKKLLMADREWSNRYLNGGAAEKQQMTALNTIIASGVN